MIVWNVDQANKYVNDLVIKLQAHQRECSLTGTDREPYCGGSEEFQDAIVEMIEVLGPYGCTWVLREMVRRIAVLSDPNKAAVTIPDTLEGL